MSRYSDTFTDELLLAAVGMRSAGASLASCAAFLGVRQNYLSTLMNAILRDYLGSVPEAARGDEFAYFWKVRKGVLS